jgi:hypothetical protein
MSVFTCLGAGIADRAEAALPRFAPPVRFSPVGSQSALLLTGPEARP